MVKPAPKIVAYYRVSTKRQGESGLGLDAQREAVTRYIVSVGGVLLTEFTEVESGRNCDRPSLNMAVRLARRENATLVVAKLDRLSRNVAFIAAVLESKCKFVACDNPMANNLTLHILAAVAEHEVGMIRDRIKVALAAAKARGTKLGSHRPGHWDGREAARVEGAKKGAKASALVRSRKAADDYLDIMPRIREMHGKNHSLQMIADSLNKSGVRTARGGKWLPVTVRMLLQRYGVDTSRQIDSPLTN